MTNLERDMFNERLRFEFLVFNMLLEQLIHEKEARVPRLFIAERAGMGQWGFRKKANKMYYMWKKNNPLSAWAIRDKRIHWERSSRGFSGYKATNLFK